MTERFRFTSRLELLNNIRRERQALEEVLARLTPAEMLLKGVAGSWSVRDVLAHISAWERRMIDWIGSHLRAEQPVVPLPWDIDRMNADANAQVKDKPLEEVLTEFRLSYRESLALVESLTEEQLQTEYSHTWPMGPLWLGVAANMNFHYREHRADISKWLSASPER